MSDVRELVSDVKFTAAGPAERSTGLLGWLRCRYGHFILDGITVRRTREGRVTLSFPVRRDRSGQSHDLVRPVDANARAVIVDAVLQGLSGALGARP